MKLFKLYLLRELYGLSLIAKGFIYCISFSYLDIDWTLRLARKLAKLRTEINMENIKHNDT